MKSEISIETIVWAVIALIALVVIAVIFSSISSDSSQQQQSTIDKLTCEGNQGTCVDKNNCAEAVVENVFCGINKVCCK